MSSPKCSGMIIDICIMAMDIYGYEYVWKVQCAVKLLTVLQTYSQSYQLFLLALSDHYSGPVEKSPAKKARGRDQTIFTNGKRRWVTHSLCVVYLTNWHNTDASSWHLHQLAEYWHHPAAVINSFSWKQASLYSLNVLIWSTSYFRVLRKELFLVITGILQGTSTLTPSLEILGLKSGDCEYLNPCINSVNKHTGVKVEQNTGMEWHFTSRQNVPNYALLFSVHY